MSQVLIEQDLSFDFSKAQRAYKLDDNAYHGMSHFFKSVDFIVETKEQLWLVEVKDPENSRIPDHLKLKEQQDFLQKMQSQSLFTHELFPKLRDSLIYLGMDTGVAEKPLRYLTLIGITNLDAAQLGGLAMSFRQQQWLSGRKGQGWRKGFDVHFFNVEQWNKSLPHFPVTRLGLAQPITVPTA
jgi:hypothetical protein